MPSFSDPGAGRTRWRLPVLEAPSGLRIPGPLHPQTQAAALGMGHGEGPVPPCCSQDLTRSVGRTGGQSVGRPARRLVGRWSAGATGRLPGVLARLPPAACRLPLTCGLLVWRCGRSIGRCRCTGPLAGCCRLPFWPVTVLSVFGVRCSGCGVGLCGAGCGAGSGVLGLVLFRWWSLCAAVAGACRLSAGVPVCLLVCRCAGVPGCRWVGLCVGVSGCLPGGRAGGWVVCWCWCGGFR